MSHYIGDCWCVYGPIGKRKDGEWSKRWVILAAFRDRQEAYYYGTDVCRALEKKPYRIEEKVERR